MPEPLISAPGDPAAAAHAGRVLPDPAERAFRTRLGQRHAAGFDWSAHYKKLTRIYLDAMTLGDAARVAAMPPKQRLTGSFSTR